MGVGWERVSSRLCRTKALCAEPENSRNFELVKCLPLGALVIVNGPVTCLPDGVEKVAHVWCEDTVITEPAQHVQLRFFRRAVQASMSCSLLGQGLPELPELDNGGDRVIEHVALGPGSVLDQ